MSSTNPSPRMPDSHDVTRRRRDVLWLAALFAIVLGGLALLALATGWQEALDQVSKLGWSQVIALLALSLVNYVFRGFRWHLFARRLGLKTGLVQNLRHFLGGFAMLVTPGRIGELIRMRWLRRETGWSLESTAPLVLMDRASDLVAMALILGIAVALSATGITGAFPITILALGAAFVATRPQLLAGITGIAYRLVGRWPRSFARLRRAARSLVKFSNPPTMIVAALLGAVGWFAEGYALYLLLGWMGADIALPLAVAIFIFSSMAGSLTGAPGGIGGAEAAMVALLSFEGVPLEISLPATAIIRLTTLWFAIAIGLVIFPLAERHSTKARNALE